jgi:hypothetical protein
MSLSYKSVTDNTGILTRYQNFKLFFQGEAPSVGVRAT